MSKLQRKAVSDHQPPSRSRRRVVWAVLCIASLVVSTSWLWHSLIEPQLFLRHAQQLLDENPRQAASLVEAAIDQYFGEFPEAEWLWTRALLRQGRHQEALGCFSLISDPTVIPAGDLLVLADEAHGAGEVLLMTFALQAVPESSDRFVEASHRLMDLKLKQGRLHEVLARGDKVLTRQGNLPLTALLMAQAYEQSKDLTRAVAAYETYLEHFDGEPTEQVRLVLQRLMHLTLQVGQLDVARRCLDDLQKFGSLTLEVRMNQAELLRAEGKSDEASTIVNSILKDDPLNLSAVALRATLAFDRHDDIAAEQDFRRVLQSEPWNKPAHYKLAIVLQRSGRQDEAESHFRENHRLTELALRVLALEKEVVGTPAQEVARLQELQSLYSNLGQVRMAEQVQRRQQAAEQTLRP